MKKIALLSLILPLSTSSLVFAGDMGGSDCAPTAFVALEGGYTWSKIDGVELTNVTTRYRAEKTQKQYSGRIAAGMISMIDDDVGITGELGWGYYGQTTFAFPETAIDTDTFLSLSSKYSLYGLDILVGAAYVQPSYSLSLKIGGLIQNMQQNNTAVITDAGIFAPGVYNYNSKSNSASVLPALKLGGAYNLDSNWSITGSYLFAYGASTGVTVVSTPTALTNFSVEVNSQNPMMNTFMLGIQYIV